MMKSAIFFFRQWRTEAYAYAWFQNASFNCGKATSYRIDNHSNYLYSYKGADLFMWVKFSNAKKWNKTCIFSIGSLREEWL